MVFRALYYSKPIEDPDVGLVLSIDNLVEKGYTIEDCAKMGFRLPNRPDISLILAGVFKGKERHNKRLQQDAESKARMGS